MSDPQQREERRRRLAELDGLLGELEYLNLADRRDVPADLANRLEQQGVRAAARKLPFQLMDAVFDLQRPILRTHPAAVRSQPSVRKAPQTVTGWVLV
jgi:hypothetical protein